MKRRRRGVCRRRESNPHETCASRDFESTGLTRSTALHCASSHSPRAPPRSIAPLIAPNCPMTRLASGRGATMPPGLRMALRSGARLGPYEIVSAIGAGRSAAWRMPWTPGRPPRRARQRRRQSRHPHAVHSPRKAPVGGHAYARLFQGLAGDAGMSLYPGRLQRRQPTETGANNQRPSGSARRRKGVTSPAGLVYPTYRQRSASVRSKRSQS